MPARPDRRVRRVYDPPEPDDGVRVLVDRLWPRGLSKERAAVDEWPKDLTPSKELRTAYHAGRCDFAQFRSRYRAELCEPAAAQALDRLRETAASGTVTLVTAVQDPEHSHVTVLVEALDERR
ncbi:DUF488 domain-containing protein [Streptomyces sp. NPDC087440]|uniref:DUF488 domain-containing protein n=1 Tax=Streptomyces sp. NPDC087440 TaxID=3365790 RepID=UPI00380FAB92